MAASEEQDRGAPRVAVIFAGGDPPDHEVLQSLPEAAYVVAADFGLVHAQQAGLAVDVVIGDLDSVPADALDDARIQGVEILEFDEDKDETDLQLALDRALALGVDRMIVLCADGGRPDHYLANVALLANARYAGVRIDAYFGRTSVAVVRNDAVLHGEDGDLITLLAVGGPATGVFTTGLRWPLAGATILPGDTVGVSNVFEGPVATVTVESGALLAIQPEGD